MNREARLLPEDGERLAWILGSSRSGSTWLLRMLRDLPEVVGIDDPHLGHHLALWRPIPLAWATAAEEPELTTLAEVKRDQDGYFFSDRYRDAWLPALRDLVLARFEAQARAEVPPGCAAPMTVVKEPGSQAAELIMEMFPRARLVFLLRDGRDVVDSWLGAYQPSSWALDEGAYPLAAEGRLAFVRWQAAVWVERAAAVQRAFAHHASERRVLVRYEDLLDDPARELQRISVMLGLRVTPREVERTAGHHEFSRVPESAKGNGRAVRSAEPGRWRQNMTAGEIAAMHEIMGAKLVELGYATEEEIRRRPRRLAAA
jgi:hypothetical protein